jgi:NTP pyrophosphatase (non-canonical NTP hydrolase)
MNHQKYLEEVNKIKNKDYNNMRLRFLNASEERLDLVHAISGIANESGELMDHLKAWMFYGHELDVKKILLELGDLYWFLTLARFALKASLETVMDMNIAKLRQRHGETFNDARNLTRDYLAEEKAATEALEKEE